MALYLIERNFADEIDLAGADYTKLHRVNDEVGVQWLQSFLSADKKKTYCLYEAESAEAIREAARRLGIPADVIIAVETVVP
jgi:hypothetical protein